MGITATAWPLPLVRNTLISVLANTIPGAMIPAGSPEVLKVALDYGADAVYLAAKEFGLRAGARNFSWEELSEGVRLAHSLGKKIYITANILAHNEDLEELEGDTLAETAEHVCACGGSCGQDHCHGHDHQHLH